MDLRIHVSTHSFLLPFPSIAALLSSVGLSVGLLSNCPIALLDIAVCPPSLPSSLFGVRRATTPPALPSFLVCWLCVVIPRYPHCSGGGGGRRRRRQRPLKVVCSDRVCKGSVSSHGALTKEDSTVAVGVRSLLSWFMYHKSACTSAVLTSWLCHINDLICIEKRALLKYSY